MWVYYGIIAGFILGFYDFWTKKAMTGNDIFPVVCFSSFFGALFWMPIFIPFTHFGLSGVYIDGINFHEQLIIFAKSLMMTFSWVFAYFSVRELPMSFSGSVRASGPIWTLVGGSLAFGEFLTPLQMTAVIISIICYYYLSQIGKKEGINTLRSIPMIMMLLATILSSLTTVYDKFIVQQMGISVFTIQAYSSIHRFIIAAALLAISIKFRKIRYHCKWSLYIPLVGVSWVLAELIYFFAISDPEASVTYLSIFRRMSLVVGFILSAIFIGEKYFFKKLIVVLLIILSAILLIFKY